MTDLTQLIGHWGYPAIFVVVVLGNVGIPIPEESILILAGYLVWRRQLKINLVLVVGVLSACMGDNVGYYVGRRYGRVAIEQYGKWLFVTSQRFQSMQRFMTRYGAVSVFMARFVPGFRFIAGPVAGTAGLPYGSFFFANLLGATIYVPLTVGLGYAMGLGFEDYIERLERAVGKIEHLVLLGTGAGALIVLAYRIFQTQKQRLFPRNRE